MMQVMFTWKHVLERWSAPEIPKARTGDRKDFIILTNPVVIYIVTLHPMPAFLFLFSYLSIVLIAMHAFILVQDTEWCKSHVDEEELTHVIKETAPPISQG